jgi:hypothetical protein
MSRLPDLSTTSVLVLSGETNFITSAAKVEPTARRKKRKRKVFIGCRTSVLLSRKENVVYIAVIRLSVTQSQSTMFKASTDARFLAPFGGSSPRLPAGGCPE